MTSLVAQAVADAPFWDRLTMAVVGPLVTAVIGTGLIGLIIVKVTNNTQRKRTEADLRRELLAKVMGAAGTLYYATQSFWRMERTNPESSKAVADSRKELDRRYLETRVQARLLEGELQALLGKELATKWHKVDDLLTVRYMELTDNDADRCLSRSAAGRRRCGHDRSVPPVSAQAGLAAGRRPTAPRTTWAQVRRPNR
ncbi:MAG TPA: hypothetical protein VGP16_32480 [Asanoa sp.]|jgi:hypothetical protein|nr:hypothetical protein [Asanoa sp.]